MKKSGKNALMKILLAFGNVKHVNCIVSSESGDKGLDGH